LGARSGKSLRRSGHKVLAFAMLSIPQTLLATADDVIE
jgi:hypothetical protein